MSISDNNSINQNSNLIHINIQFGNGDSYHGEVLNNKKHGNGEYNFSNGENYKGEFSEGLFNGKGIYKYNNGDIYNGEWKNGKKKWKRYFYL